VPCAVVLEKVPRSGDSKLNEEGELTFRTFAASGLRRCPGPLDPIGSSRSEPLSTGEGRKGKRAMAPSIGVFARFAISGRAAFSADTIEFS
jgi:hypothetical protein